MIGVLPLVKYGVSVLQKRSGRDGASNAIPALDITHLFKETRMPFDGNITARGDSANVEDSQNSWQSIGELARKLAKAVGGDV